LASVALDSLTTSTLYVGTLQGEILLFESHNSALKSESLDCKLLGKFNTRASNQRQMEEKLRYDIRGLKGSIIAHYSDGVFEVLNTSSVKALLEEATTPFTYLPKSEVMVGDPFMSDVKLQNGNLLLVNERQDGKDRLVIYECIVPYFRPDSIFDSFNLKVPMFLVAFFMVIFF